MCSIGQDLVSVSVKVNLFFRQDSSGDMDGVGYLNIFTIEYLQRELESDSQITVIDITRYYEQGPGGRLRGQPNGYGARGCYCCVPAV